MIVTALLRRTKVVGTGRFVLLLTKVDPDQADKKMVKMIHEEWIR